MAHQVEAAGVREERAEGGLSSRGGGREEGGEEGGEGGVVPEVVGTEGMGEVRERWVEGPRHTMNRGGRELRGVGVG